MRIRNSIGISLLVGALGCETPQAEVCASYVACQEAYDAATDTGPVDVTQYEADGACWDGPESAALCSADCEEALIALAEAADGEGLVLGECVAPTTG